MKNQLGLGVMIKMMFSGNQETVAALNASANKVIKILTLKNGNERTGVLPEEGDEDELQFVFEDGSKLKIWDGGQSCCEHRYMRTDDDLAYFVGSTLVGVEVKDAQGIEDPDGECHDIQFLDVTTSKGVFQIANHNEHNGYYGGFHIEAKFFSE